MIANRRELDSATDFTWTVGVPTGASLEVLTDGAIAVIDPTHSLPPVTEVPPLPEESQDFSLNDDSAVRLAETRHYSVLARNETGKAVLAVILPAFAVSTSGTSTLPAEMSLETGNRISVEAPVESGAIVLGVATPLSGQTTTKPSYAPSVCPGTNQAITIWGTKRMPGSKNVIYGTDGDDVIWGGPSDNIIRPSEGDDVVCAVAGADLIDAGARSDITSADETLLGGAGEDLIYAEELPAAEAASPTNQGTIIDAGRGADTIVGSTTVSLLDAGAGADRIYAYDAVTVLAGSGDDVVYGSAPPEASMSGEDDEVATISSQLRDCNRPHVNGSDAGTYCAGGQGNERYGLAGGNDTFFGQKGNDPVDGGTGNDRLYGGIGDDVLDGNAGDDVISGGMGADKVNGSAGDDLVRGDGTRDDLVTGGPDFDTVSFATGVTPGFENRSMDVPFPKSQRGVYVRLSGEGVADNGQAPDGGGDDTRSPDGEAFVAQSFESVIGTAFSDYIVGSPQRDFLFGGGGGDVLLGAGGKDVLNGGADEDHLAGHAGADRVSGDGGDDYCTGGANPCERQRPGANERQSSTISVGMWVAPADLQNANTPVPLRYTSVYVTGGNGDDNLTVSYVKGSPSIVKVVRTGGSSPFISGPDAADAGCARKSDLVIECEIVGGKPLDSVIVAGWNGDDFINANGFNFPTSVVILGGGGVDDVNGDDTEDLLVSGPGIARRTGQMNGNANDDAIINQDESNDINAGAGDDLILTTTLCDGDSIHAGAGSLTTSSLRSSTRRLKLTSETDCSDRRRVVSTRAIPTTPKGQGAPDQSKAPK